MTYTASDVLDSIRHAVKRHPDRSNPFDDALGCLYTSPDDPDHHCIAGQVLVDLGFDVPQAGDRLNSKHDPVDIADSHAFTEAAIDLLEQAQDEFDAEHDRLTWEETLARVEADLELAVNR